MYIVYFKEGNSICAFQKKFLFVFYLFYFSLFFYRLCQGDLSSKYSWRKSKFANQSGIDNTCSCYKNRKRQASKKCCFSKLYFWIYQQYQHANSYCKRIAYSHASRCCTDYHTLGSIWIAVLDHKSLSPLGSMLSFVHTFQIPSNTTEALVRVDVVTENGATGYAIKHIKR